MLATMFIGTVSASIALNWTAPTTNTDGSTLTDLRGYMLYYGTGSPCTFTNGLDVGNVTNYSISLANGTYCFAVTAYNSTGNYSDYSNTVYKTESAGDSARPIVTAFTIPGTSSSLNVPITLFTATDNVGVTGYMVSESASVPSAADSGWSSTAQTSYTFATTGSKTLYAWAKDAAGNVSASLSASVTVSVANTMAVNLSPAYDTYLDIDSNNYSNSSTLDTYTWPNDKVANTILMKFDLSSIPAGSTIQSATLYLYMTEADSISTYPTYNLTLNRIINRNPDLTKASGYTYDGVNSWTPNSNCFNNIPLAQADISTAYDIRAIDKSVGFKGWNATQLISDWISNPSTNYGLVINSDASKAADTYRNFASSKFSTAAYRPYLSITYVTACLNPRFEIAGAMYNYQSIQTAYDGLASGETLQIQAGTFNENLNLQQSNSVAMQGGYSCDFSSNSGYTTVHGSLTIADGKVSIGNLIIQ